jgi:hypothetical protein
MRSRRARATVAAVAAVLASVLAVPGVTAVAQQPPPPPPEPELPDIPPTVCLDHEPETAADYNAFFGGALGMWQAGDVPHRYPLPDGRVLWLTNDSFLSPLDPSGPLTADSGFVHNAAFVQAGTCVTAVATLDADHHPQPFLPDPAPGHWYWPLGGVVQGDSLLVFLAELSAPLPLSWALRLTARRTMIATIDWRTLAVTDIEPAPDPGVAPFYGFSVVDDGTYTYLFGNNLVYGTNTATRLARVPSGRLGAAAYEYWTGSSWSASRSDAAPVHDPGGYSYALQVSLVADRWYAVAKQDDFLGANIDVLTASEPTGSWRVGATFRVPVKSTAGQNTYDAGLIGELRAGGRVVMMWSNNNFGYAPVAADPSLYRPTFGDVQLPRQLLRHRTRAAFSPGPRVVAV